jgi:fidgetin-like protein 1
MCCLDPKHENRNGAKPGSSCGNRQTNTTPEESDDNLPEELQRFGKDLVEKIESEIMISGDKISFDDIAGLEDQKQIVREVVCNPIKRPDMFTGLRSAPNGLLLYGPPGTGKYYILL